MESSIKSKLIKIYNLSVRGVGGEKANAESLLKKMLAKHGLTIDEILDGEFKDAEELKWYPVRTASDKALFFQCLASVIHKSEFSTSRNRRKRGIIGVNLSKLNHVELCEKYAFFKKLYKKESDEFRTAFYLVNNLYNPKPSESKSSDDKKDYSGIFEKMRGITKADYCSTRRRLTK